MIVYTENFQKSMETLPRTNKRIQQGRRRQNQHKKNLSYFYIVAMNMETQIQNVIPFTIAEKMKYSVTVTKHVQYLYAENYKMLMKETKADLNKLRSITCSWIRKPNIVKMSFVPEPIHKFNTIPIKTLARLFL